MLQQLLERQMQKQVKVGELNKGVVESTVMTNERGSYSGEIDKRNTSDEVTEERIYQNLQIDGDKPSRGLVRQIIAKIRGKINGPRTDRPSV